MATRPSGGVNLTAFDRRFSNICRQARLSATSSTKKSVSARTRPTFPFSAFSRNMSQQSLTKGSNSNGSGQNFKFSRLDLGHVENEIDHRKKMFGGRMDNTRIFDPLRGFGRREFGVPRISENPKIALSGVRNSWLTFARSLSFSEMASAVSARADSSRCRTSVATETSRVTDRTTVSRCLPASRSRGSPRRRISTHVKTRLVKSGSGSLEGARSQTQSRRGRHTVLRRGSEGREGTGSVRDMNSTVETCSQKIFRVDLKMPSILAADRQNPPAEVVFHDQIADSFAKRLKMIGAPELDAPSTRRLPRPTVDHERRAVSRPRAEQFREAAPASFDQEHRTKTPRAEFDSTSETIPAQP